MVVSALSMEAPFHRSRSAALQAPPRRAFLAGPEALQWSRRWAPLGGRRPHDQRRCPDVRHQPPRGHGPDARRYTESGPCPVAEPSFPRGPSFAVPRRCLLRDVATRGLPAGDQRRLSAGARRAIVTSPDPGDFNLTTFGDAFARRTAAALPLCAMSGGAVVLVQSRSVGLTRPSALVDRGRSRRSPRCTLRVGPRDAQIAVGKLTLDTSAAHPCGHLDPVGVTHLMRCEPVAAHWLRSRAFGAMCGLRQLTTLGRGSHH